MNRKTTGIHCCSAALLASFLVPSMALAGPLPLKELYEMRGDAELKLKIHTKRFEAMTALSEVQEAFLKKLQVIAKKTKSAEVERAVQKAERDLVASYKVLERIERSIQLCEQRIEWIVVQIEQWEAMESEKG